MFKSTSQYTRGRGVMGRDRDVYCQGHRLIHKGEEVEAERERLIQNQRYK